MRAIAVVAALAGCAGTPNHCVGNKYAGDLGRVEIYGSAGAHALDPRTTPLASGGAHANVEVSPCDGNPTPIAALTSSDASVVAVVAPDRQEIVPPGVTFGVMTGAVGSAVLSARDSDGRERDRFTIRVLDATEIDFVEATPNVIADTPLAFRVVARRQDVELGGTSEVRFSFAGSVSETYPQWQHDGYVGFVGTPGSGTIAADSAGAHAEYAVNVFDESAVTALSADTTQLHAGDDVSIDAFAGPTFVAGARCRWSSTPTGASAQWEPRPVWDEPYDWSSWYSVQVTMPGERLRQTNWALGPIAVDAG